MFQDKTISRARQGIFRGIAGCTLMAALLLAAPTGAAGEIIILQDGQTIQADTVEDLGDRYRVGRPGASFDLPKERVMTIHPTTPPSGTPAPSSPADVYKDMTREMNEKVRRDIQSK